MNNTIQIIDKDYMDSREIAGLTGRTHKSILKTVRKMLIELNDVAAPGGAARFESTFVDDRGQTQPCFHLPKRECLILASGFNVKLRAAIIDRWADLESGKVTPIGTNPLTATHEELDIQIKRQLNRIQMIVGDVSAGVKVATALECREKLAQDTGITIELPKYIQQFIVESKNVEFDLSTDVAFAAKVAIGRNYITVSQIAKDFHPLTSTDINSMLVNMGYLKRTGHSTYSVTNAGREFASTRTLQSGPNKGVENVTGWNLDDIRFWKPFKEMLIAQRDLKKKQLANKRR